MAFLGLRAWPTPFWRPMSHFLVAGAFTFWLVSKTQTAMLQIDEYKFDSRNPYAGKRGMSGGH